jgi:hypothetical protein
MNQIPYEITEEAFLSSVRMDMIWYHRISSVFS